MLTQFQNYANTSVSTLNQTCSSEISNNPNFGHQLGVKLGNLLGTCDEYGQITESSYPLDRYVDYIYQQRSLFSNLFSSINKKAAYFFTKLTRSIFTDTRLTSTSEQVDILKEAIKQMTMEDLKDFRDFYKKFIDASIKKARAKNKPLLLLLGETHDQLSTSLLESIVIFVSSQTQNLNFNTVFTETFDANFYQDPDDLANPCNVVEKLIEHLKLIKIQMDLASCHIYKPDIPEICKVIDHTRLMSGIVIDTVEKATLKEGLKKRNQIMAEVMIAFKNTGDAIAVVGKGHLYGIMRETKLQDHYHVVPIEIGPKLPSDIAFNHNHVCENEYLQTYINYLKDPSINKFIYSLDFFDNVSLLKIEDVLNIACEASHETEKAKAICRF